jgi:hypothetical protein
MQRPDFTRLGFNESLAFKRFQMASRHDIAVARSLAVFHHHVAAAFFQVPPGQEISFLHPLLNKWLPGIGPKAAPKCRPRSKRRSPFFKTALN